MNQTNKPHPRTYVLTGRIQSGKDYVADQFIGVKLGFSDPIRKVIASLFGENVPPGQLHNTIGEWGKGVIDDQHPLTIERASFVLLMRKLGPELCDLPVSWGSFGKHPGIWIEALLGRAHIESGEIHAPLDGPFYPERDIFVTTARMKTELAELRKAGFDHFHVMCSEQTLIERLRQKGIALGDQRLKHVSEMMATELDRQVYAHVRKNPAGPKLKVIWNDVRDCPSDRLFSLDEFKTYIENNAGPKPELPPEVYPSEDETPAPDLRDCSPHDEAAPEEEPAGEPKNRNPRKRPRAGKNP